MKFSKVLIIGTLIAAAILGVVIIPKMMHNKKFDVAQHDTMEFTFIINNQPYTQQYPIIDYIFPKDVDSYGPESRKKINLVALVDLTKLPNNIQKELRKQYQPTSHYVVVTEAGKVITDVGFTQTALMGTPGHLWWENYLGSLHHPLTKEEQQRVGSGRRTDFCEGTCRRKSEKN